MKRSLSLLVLGWAAFASSATLTNRPIAVVNGEPILLSEFKKNWETVVEQQKGQLSPGTMDDEWKKEARQDLLDQMIDDKVLLTEARNRKVKVNQRDFENGVLQVKARFLPDSAKRDLEAMLRRQAAAQGAESPPTPDLGGAWRELQKSSPSAIKTAEAEFKKELEKEGLDLKKFEERIREQLSVVQLSNEVVQETTKPPTDEDVKALFDRVSDKLKGKSLKGLTPDEERDVETLAKYFARETGERVRARHILIGVPDDKGVPNGWEKAPQEKKDEARKTIAALRKRIEAGADFAEVAEVHSHDKASAARGGDLGFFTRGQMVPAFEKTAFSLPVGQMSEIIESPFGLHIILVEEKKAAAKLRFDDAEDDLRRYLFNAARQKAFEDFTKSLRDAATIKVLIPPDELASL